MRRAVLLALFAIPGLGSAQTIYTWTDSRGTVHFTDDRSTVPDNVKVTTTAGEELSNMGSSPSPVPAQPAAVAPAAAAAASPTAKSDEEYWRGEFKRVNEKIRSLEDELAVDEGRFNDPSRTPLGPSYACSPGFYTPGFISRPGFAPGFVGRSQVVQGGFGASLNLPLGSGASLGLNAGAGSVATRGATTGAFTGVVPFVGYGGACFYQPYGDYVYNRERIERTRVQLARAKEDLADLERRAANAAVPLEWRR